MTGVADCTGCHSVSFRFFDELFHHAVARNHAHAVMSIINKRCGRFAQHFNICDGIQYSLFEPVDINRFETIAAVALYPPSVAFNKNIGADLRIPFGNAIAHERIFHEICDNIPRDIGSRFGHL